MKSPANQKIVQIDITNACPHRCSNCTRHCGHHRKPFFMDYDTFVKAVDSLEGHGGMVGIMGGEPTIHPDFERLIDYYRGKVAPETAYEHARLPLAEFTEHAEENLAFETTKHRGLFTSLGAKYYEHFEVIQDTFSYQCINDHRHPGLHQGLLISRRDLGIPDEEWIPMRDACWIQNLWSSCITPKGAFFCEVAAAFDMLFDGPGGWPVEPGWWKRTPEEFGEQLNWCELCGAALQVPRRPANEEVDDVSPTLLEKLKAIGSPQEKQGRVRVLDVATYNPEDWACKPSNEWYLPDEDNSERIADTNATLYPKEIDAIVITRTEEAVAGLKAEAERQFDRVVVAASAHDGDDRPKLLRRAFDQLQPKDWVVVLDEDVVLEDGFGDQLRGWILNPGCLYEFTRHRCWASKGKALVRTDSRLGDNDRRDPNVFCSVFNVRARSLRPVLAEGAIDAGLWPDDKRIDLHAFLLQPDPLAERRRQGKEFAGQALAVCNALSACGHRIALFGAGHHTKWLLDLVKAANQPMPVLIFDDNPYTYDMAGVQVKRPEAADATAFDAVIISADPGRMTRILAQRCRDIWGQDAPVVTLYQGLPEGRFMKIGPS